MVYVLTGFFGYATFASKSEVEAIMSSQNIFTAPYLGNSFIVAAMFLMAVGVVLSTPLSVLPCKDAIEEMTLGQTRMLNSFENLIVTTLIVFVCFVFALAVRNIGEALQLVGAVTNPIVGFILPSAYYLKVNKGGASNIIAVINPSIMTVLSLGSLYVFFCSRVDL
jgi:amino acid permease